MKYLDKNFKMSRNQKEDKQMLQMKEEIKENNKIDNYQTR